MALTKEQINIFKIRIERADNIRDYIQIAFGLVKAGDKAWAKKIIINNLECLPNF